MANYILAAQTELENYKTLRAAADRMEKEITRIRRKLSKTSPGPGGLTTNYSGEHGSTAFYDFETVANELINKDAELCNTLAKVESMNDALDKLATEIGEPDYQKVLILWHIEELSKEDICKVMKYESRKSIYNLYNKAIKKFAILLFGSTALDNYINEGKKTILHKEGTVF